MRLPRPFVIALVLAAALLAACGGDDAGGVGSETGAQPQTQDARFVSGEFTGLPLPSGAQTFGSLTSDDGVTTQTYEVSGSTPERVLEFYDRELTADGWTAVQAPTKAGTTVYQGRWTDEAGRVLEVSSSPISVDDPDSGTTQFSLVLRDD